VRLVLKSLGWITLLVLLLLVGLLVAVAYKPQWLVSAFNATQNDWQLDAPALNIDILPPAIDLPALQLQGAGTNVQLTNASARLNPSAWWQQQPFWQLVAEQADIEVTASEPVAEEPAGALSIPDIAQFLTFSNVEVNKVNLSGDTSLTAQLAAERSDGVVNLSAQATIDSATYALTGVISESDDQQLSLIVDATARDAESAEPLSADAHIEAALTRPNGTVALAISTGSVSASVAGKQHDVQQLSGSASLLAGGEVIKLSKFTGSYLGAPLEQPINFQADGEVGLTGESRDVDLEFRAGDSVVAFDGRYGADFSEVIGDISISSSGVPQGISADPYVSSDLFPATVTSSLRYGAEPTQLVLTKLDVKTPTNVLAGEMDLTLAEALVLRADLQAERLYFPLTSSDGDEDEEGEARRS